MSENIIDRIEILKNIRSIREIRELFINVFNFGFKDADISNILSEKIRNDIDQMRIIAEYEDFNIILCVLKRLLQGTEKEIFRQISQKFPDNLIVFTDTSFNEWHFVNRKPFDREKTKDSPIKLRPFRRIVIGKDERLRTAAERLFLLAIEETDTSLLIQKKCDKAFDVEGVTRAFYSDFVSIYKAFRDEIKKINKINREIADEVAQKIFNRMIFLYYLQKKGYLNGDKYYLHNKFEEIINSGESGNYFDDVLIPLFKKLSIREFTHTGFENIPFLNGGLFDFEDKEADIKIENGLFQNLFDGLLEHYNFTIREDTDFEQEVAIDPEMLGTIFEQLILKLEEARASNKEYNYDARRSSGSYYTPKFIVSFMVKQTILNHLKQVNPVFSKSGLKELVFSLKGDSFSCEQKRKMKSDLEKITVVDPAVGSGAFIVGYLLKLLEIIETLDTEIDPETTKKPCYRYNKKLNIIQHNIYGVDIQPRAVNLSNLRLWLSLIVDLDVEDPLKIPALPNLDFHIFCGNSLVSHIGNVSLEVMKGIKVDRSILDLLDKYREMRETHTLSGNREARGIAGKIDLLKIEILKKIKNLELKIEMKKAMKIDPKEHKKLKKIGQHYEKLKKADVDQIGFNWGIDFFDIIINGGFDVVIGNPPYGLKEKDEVKEEFHLGSKDSYGIFTALGLEILKPGGTLSYIMSDTWQTIRSHKQLRDILLEKTHIQNLISVPSDTFKAAVNVGVYSFLKKDINKDEEINWILAADFSPLSIFEGQVEAALELLSDLEPPVNGADPNQYNHPCIYNDELMGYTEVSERDWALFLYRQNLINLFSNHSFFIASPKLFLLMQDEQQAIYKDPENQLIIRKLASNSRNISVYKLGEIADIDTGITTGDNDYYLRQSRAKIAGVKKNYKLINKDLVLNEIDLINIRTNSEMRDAIIDKGIFRESGAINHFDGRYFIPYYKGGSSKIDAGWLPNYYVPTDFFIDWSEESVQRMKSLTIAERMLKEGKSKNSIKKHYYHTNAAIFRNMNSWFREGITSSSKGEYSPTFRLMDIGLFDKQTSAIFPKFGERLSLLGLLSSKFFRFSVRNFLQNTVSIEADALKLALIPLHIYNTNLTDLVNSIVKKQKKDLLYDFMTNEQVEIDKIVYEMYNLNEQDIHEVETWFFRRYPTLANNIEKKLKEKEKQNVTT